MTSNRSPLRRFVHVVFACCVLSIAGSPLLSADQRASAAANDATTAPRAAIEKIVVRPASIELRGARDVRGLLVDGLRSGTDPLDLTHAVEYASDATEVARVSTDGLVRAVGNGRTVVTVRHEGRSVAVPVTVAESDVPRVPDFETDIVPILSRFGCNTSGCHGKAEGQAGFKLSVFGFDPLADHAALVKEGRGRRTFLAVPDRSLLLVKATGGMPHGGGVRIPAGSDDARALHDWIAAGAPFRAAEVPAVTALTIVPRERRLDPGAVQQLRAIATFADGGTRDVTRLAKFQSNAEGLATVDERGLVRAGGAPGTVAVMASFLGHVDTFRAFVPRPGPAPTAAGPEPANFVDRHVFAQLRQLGIAPSEPAGDAEFLRRVHLDLTGLPPTPEEARRFLADPRPDRRARLVDDLLERPEFADRQALDWADLLRVDRQTLGHKDAYRYYRWIRSRFAEHVPLDRFASELLTAEGLLSEQPGGALFKVVKDPGQVAATVSQVFLGIRIDCARCHHHPYDRWGQDDYYGMQGCFAQVAFKPTPHGEWLTASKNGAVTHPRTGAPVAARPLGGADLELPPTADRRRAFAEWLVDPRNPWFARNLANRTWARLLGRGLVDPVDDVRSTNPPSHPELLDALAADLVAGKYEVRHLIRTIVSSRTYQASSRPNETNADDERNFSRAVLRPLEAEVLLDAVCQTTGVPERFEGSPPGTRAQQLWDSRVEHAFLKLFGRPARTTPCTCERSSSPSIAQVLNVLNGSLLQGKLAHAGGRLADLRRRFPNDDGALVEELYLACFARFPEPEERAAAVDFLKRHADDRVRATEDLAWTLLNSHEFLFRH